MVQLAQEYLKAMKIENTQFIVVKHGNTDHPHCHIVFNRVDNEGETISDKNDHYRNIEVCKQIKDKYNLTYGKGKEQTNIQKLKGAEKAKYEIYKIVSDSLKKSKNWNQFRDLLKQKGVEIQFKYKGQTDEVQGISFKKGTYSFKGSEVDRKFSFAKLNNQLQQSSIRQTINDANNPTLQGASLVGSVVDGLGTLSTSQAHGDDYEEEMFKDRIDYEEKRRQQKNKRKRRLGM
nr:relaxase/mobilization nuclease domain-containing protein [Dysgonomonas sp. Marseille-P4677]